MVQHESEELFGITLFVKTAPRMKFTMPVLPDTTVRLTLAYNKDKKQVTYSYCVPDSNEIYSTGTFSVEQSPFKPGFIIPVYRHGAAVEHVIEQIEHYNAPIIVIDDGNDASEKTMIEKAVAAHPLCILVTRKETGGKGKAVADGVVAAHEMGLTHVLQIDADGQHDTERCSAFITEAEQHKDTVICGYPEYDESVPLKRKNGRVFANVWCRIVSASDSINDAMCGFRIYPFEPMYSLLRKHRIASRMGFDIDIIVRLAWAGIPILSSPVKVSYPEDGISNFKMIRDNIDISLLFSRLCLGMIVRLPLFCARAVKNAFIKMNRRNAEIASV